MFFVFSVYFRKTRSTGEGFVGDVGRFRQDLFATLPSPGSAHSIRQVVQERRGRDNFTREQVKKAFLVVVLLLPLCILSLLTRSISIFE